MVLDYTAGPKFFFPDILALGKTPRLPIGYHTQALHTVKKNIDMHHSTIIMGIYVKNLPLNRAFNTATAPNESILKVMPDESILVRREKRGWD